MSHSRVQCEICNRNMRSDHLKRHMKTHKNGSIWLKPKEIPTFNGSEFGTDKPKSRETMNKLRRFVLNKDAEETPRKVSRVQANEILNSILEDTTNSKNHEIGQNDENSLNSASELSEEDKEDEEEEELKIDERDELQDSIQSTVEYLLKHDQDELLDLITDFKDVADKEFIVPIHRIEELVDKFLVDEYLDGELILPQILNISKELELSALTKSKRYRLEMLLNDIDKNRYRVKSILTQLDNAQDEEDIDNTLKRLAQEDLISTEQYEKLKENDAAFELPSIVAIIKDTKIGNGLKFLPRTIRDLKRKLQLILTEVTVTGIDAMKKELIAILDELLRQKGISVEDYNDVSKEL